MSSRYTDIGAGRRGQPSGDADMVYVIKSTATDDRT
jgi:hypothetical protein